MDNCGVDCFLPFVTFSARPKQIIQLQKSVSAPKLRYLFNSTYSSLDFYPAFIQKWENPINLNTAFYVTVLKIGGT
jgi:hypothetical protein